MATNLTLLKQRKGTPPKANQSLDVIREDQREADIELRPLQVRIPSDIFEAFSEQAAKEFGYSHGSKKKLFLKMWNSYKAQTMKR